MAILRIDGNVKIGHIYECNFGMFKKNEVPQAEQPQAVTKDKGVRLENGKYPTLSLFFVQTTIH